MVFYLMDCIGYALHLKVCSPYLKIVAHWFSFGYHSFPHSHLVISLSFLGLPEISGTLGMRREYPLDWKYD